MLPCVQLANVHVTYMKVDLRFFSQLLLERLTESLERGRWIRCVSVHSYHCCGSVVSSPAIVSVREAMRVQ